MLSDVLSDALAEIERYRTDPVFAGCYAALPWSAKLDALVDLMAKVLRELDAPLSPADIEALIAGSSLGRLPEEESDVPAHILAAVHAAAGLTPCNVPSSPPSEVPRQAGPCTACAR